MKKNSSYFPFLVISLVLYGFIFIHIDQPKQITTLPLNSGEQAIQVQFIVQPNASENFREDNLAQPSEQRTVVDPPVAVEKVQPQKVITGHAKNPKISESEVKIKKQALLERITKTGADSAAHLKAEAFEQQLASDQTKNNETEQPSNTKTQHEASLLQTGSSAIKKAVVKKSPPANSSSPTSSTKNQGVLQEAIVVSGRKPVYPQRAILRDQQGRVVVKLTVTEKGRPKNPKIQISSGFSLLDNAVLAFINQELFMPALQGEDKVISEQLFAFRFELN